MTTTQERSVSPHKQGQVPLHLDNPPVTEVSAGFYFQKIDGWNILYQGLLWDRFRKEYPVLEILPTVVDPTRQPIVQFDLNAPTLRTGFTDPSRTQLVQFQETLLLHNWRKTPQDPTYQRYERLREHLREDWATFTQFLQQNSLRDPAITRCEISYFNHFVRNEHWKEYSDLADLLTVWRTPPPSDTFGTIQMLAFNVWYRMATGTVTILVQPGIRPADGKEIIQFSLTSSAAPKTSETAEIFGCLDECHQNALRAFVDFTTDIARERWKQKK